MGVLHRGYVYEPDGGSDWFTEWHDEVSTELLYASYAKYAKARNERRPLAREAFGEFLTSVADRGGKRLTNQPIGETKAGGIQYKSWPTGYVLGDLDAARDRFLMATKLTAEWPAEYDTLTPDEAEMWGDDLDVRAAGCPPAAANDSWGFEFQESPASGQ